MHSGRINSALTVRFFQSALIFAKFRRVLISLFPVTVFLVGAALKSNVAATLAVF